MSQIHIGSDKAGTQIHISNSETTVFSRSVASKSRSSSEETIMMMMMMISVIIMY